MRSDFLGALQNDEPLFAVHRKIDLPPLREAELSKVIRGPAKQLSARFESDVLVDVITSRTLEDSAKDVGALPLLSYTLDDMWTEMVRHGDGVLRLPTATFELGRVLAERANSFLARNPAAEDMLRRGSRSSSRPCVRKGNQRVGAPRAPSSRPGSGGWCLS
jgi:hypothetical protein